MKKSILVASVAMTVGVHAFTFIPSAESPQEKNAVTELFMVQSISGDGQYMEAKAIDSESMQAEYILDPMYEIGDVVEVTYYNDDIFAERKITGDELDDILENEYVRAEDGSYVPVGFYK